MATDISKIRNVGFAGHGGVGKTSLVEGILFAAGAVNRLGKVDDGTTTTDFDPDEIKRKISLGTSIALCDWKGHPLNLLHTPGGRAGGRARGQGGQRGGGCGGGGAGAGGEGLEVRQRVRAAPRHRHQPPRSRARRFLPYPRVPPEAAQRAPVPAPDPRGIGVLL